ncbi:MAG: GGDEF domain-containing protein [Labilithrix sp.]|nr:GGDEF domain-containing protein [Labilithrix sp.]
MNAPRGPIDARRARFALGAGALALAVSALATAIPRWLSLDPFVATLGVTTLALMAASMILARDVDVLEHHALDDPISPVGRRRWERRLRDEVERAVRSRMPLSLLVLDVDRSRALDDAHGHACGDLALALVGGVVRATCRSRDVAARFGGDELALLLPRTRAAEARVVAERIRRALARRRDRAFPLTVSIGIADLASLREARPELLFAAADGALRAAKAAGRDRVVIGAPARGCRVISLDARRAAKRGFASA